MKNYTIKEFAEGKKAVKIENEEQWNKLNKVHKLTLLYHGTYYYSNRKSYFCGYTRQEIIDSNWEVLEFSQLDFEDEFVEGWYRFKLTKNLYRNVLRNEIIWSSGRFQENYSASGDNLDSMELLTDLSEIQPFLPSNHPDLIKKDTFVLPKKWAVKPTESELDIVWDFCGKGIKDKKGENAYYHYPHFPSVLDNPCTHSYKIKPGYTEITFEEFKTHILKESTMEKEILGYKLVKPEYEKATIKLLGWNFTTKLLINISEKGDIHRLKEAGVLDLWFEAVLRDTLPKIGSYEGKLENDFIQYGCKKFNKEKAKSFIELLEYFSCESIIIEGNTIKSSDFRVIKSVL